MVPETDTEKRFAMSHGTQVAIKSSDDPATVAGISSGRTVAADGIAIIGTHAGADVSGPQLDGNRKFGAAP